MKLYPTTQQPTKDDATPHGGVRVVVLDGGSIKIAEEFDLGHRIFKEGLIQWDHLVIYGWAPAINSVNAASWEAENLANLMSVIPPPTEAQTTKSNRRIRVDETIPITQKPTRDDIQSGYINVVFAYNDNRIAMQEMWHMHRWMFGDSDAEDKGNKIRVLGWIPGNGSINFSKWFNDELFGEIPYNQEKVTISIEKRRIRVDEN